MFVYLSKILPQFLMPMGLGLELLLLSLFWSSFWSLLRRRSSGKRASVRGGGVTGVTAFLALLVLWVPATPVCSDLLLRGLERQYPVLSSQASPTADAIVVLGGGTSNRGPLQPEVELGASGGRLLHAFRLYKNHKAPLMILSGGSLHPDVGDAEAEQMRRILSEWGVPDSAMVLENRSLNTHENAVEVVRLARERGLRSLLLVTSAFHMPRSMAIFLKEAGATLTLRAAPTGQFASQKRPYLLSDWLPDANALANSTLALRERIGMLVYHSRGWL